MGKFGGDFGGVGKKWLLENKSGNISETRKRKSYYGGPIETYQRCFERYHTRPHMASPSSKFGVFTAQCTLVHLRGLGIACRLSVCPSVCNVRDL